MAKPLTPAEASLHARRPQPVQQVQVDAPARANPRAVDPRAVDPRAVDPRAVDPRAVDPRAVDPRGLNDDAFDTTRDLSSRHLEAGRYAKDEGRADGRSSERSEHALSDEDVIDDADLESVFSEAAAAADVGARNPSAEPRPGLAWVRHGAAFSGSASSSGSGSRAPKVPLASLEPPSTSQLDLTPSPVPRVALAPATGAVDISLVPGPHQVGSRNLPTLAAQHLRARRAPRRPAAAVTVPPSTPPQPASRLSLAGDVRSSKGEIVLGLTIGLGVSLLLAGLGQAYLRGDAVVADEQSSPGVESVTLSARPERALHSASSGAEPSLSEAAGATAVTPGAVTPGAVTPSAGDPRGVAPVEREVAARHAGAAPMGSASPRGGRPRQAAASTASRASTLGTLSDTAGGDTASRDTASRETPLLLAQAAAPKTAEARRAASAARAASARNDSVLDTSQFDASQLESRSITRKPAQSGASSAAPLTPAESAGLGLDLPL